jgi:predicted nucleic acid-binding protein
MTGRVFVDSNVPIYAHDLDAGVKQRLAAERHAGVTQKIPAPLSKGAAREVVRNYAAWVHAPQAPATVVRASEISEVWRLSFRDAMMVAAAQVVDPFLA